MFPSSAASSFHDAFSTTSSHFPTHASSALDGNPFTAIWGNGSMPPLHPHGHFSLVSPPISVHTAPTLIDPRPGKRLCRDHDNDSVLQEQHGAYKRPKSSSSSSETGYVSKEAFRKLKNRQSAARSRKKALAKVRQLEQRVTDLELENNYLVSLLASVSATTTSPFVPSANNRIDFVAYALDDSEW